MGGEEELEKNKKEQKNKRSKKKGLEPRVRYLIIFDPPRETSALLDLECLMTEISELRDLLCLITLAGSGEDDILLERGSGMLKSNREKKKEEKIRKELRNEPRIGTSIWRGRINGGG